MIGATVLDPKGDPEAPLPSLGAQRPGIMQQPHVTGMRGSEPAAKPAPEQEIEDNQNYKKA